MTAPGTPTPSDDGTHASWLPRDIAYSSAFEDSIAELLLHSSYPDDATVGLRVLPVDSLEEPEPGRTVHPASISSLSLPKIAFTALPLPLSDNRRIYASAVPGVLLTHPSGYLEGGPCIAPSEDEFARHFLSDNGIRTSARLKQVVGAEIEANLQLAKERMKAREEAKEKNGAVERELRTLEDQMEMEMRVLEKARQKARERKEKRARKAKERD